MTKKKKELEKENTELKAQIEKMQELYNSFSDEDKPEWLTMEEIIKYEKEMIKEG